MPDFDHPPFPPMGVPGHGGPPPPPQVDPNVLAAQEAARERANIIQAQIAASQINDYRIEAERQAALAVAAAQANANLTTPIQVGVPPPYPVGPMGFESRLEALEAWKTAMDLRFRHWM